MEDDQEVAVILLNLGGTGEEAINTSWEDNFSALANDLSLNITNESDTPDQDFRQNETLNCPIQKDLEFIRKHASDADPGFLHSLLDSQIDNPKRLESVMCEVLNIPNALELIQEFRRNNVKTGSKRTKLDSNTESGDAKKKKEGDAESYLQQIRDMFPDADGLFLISECQQLESWEDCSRFINTVMISGLYPKKGTVEYAPKNEIPKVVEIIDKNDYRTVDLISSEDEISSSGLLESPRSRKRRKKKNRDSGNCFDESPQPSSSGTSQLIPPEVEVVDIASVSTESYEPPDAETLQEIFNQSEVLNNVMEVDEVPPIVHDWESSLFDDVNKLLQQKFGVQPLQPETVTSETPQKSQPQAVTLDTPQPGPSRVNVATPTIDNGLDDEKSLAEIIEEKRHSRRRSLDSAVRVLPEIMNSSEKEEQEMSSSEVSTTSLQRNDSGVWEAAIVDESDDTFKVAEEWLDEQTANLIRIFPNADPSFLKEEVRKMNGSSEAVNEFVISKLERNDMPTRADYEKRLEMEELQNRYTKNFSIEDFLKVVPDPWKYFTDGNRNCTKYKTHSLCYLKSAFRKHYVRDIINTFGKNKYNLYVSYQELMKTASRKKGFRRSEFECNSNRPTTIDIQFLQEVAFIENEEKIKDYLEGEKLARQIKFDEAKRTGSLLECQCCFDSEVMVEDIVYCPKDHSFCKDCIIKCVEVEMGYGRCQFECLASCDEKFSLACLQGVLKPELFSKVIQATQMEEIRAAEIEDLVQCPFCSYATIMPPEEKVMTCLNPECLKESCRLCKELNHIPLRCDEVEKSEDVKLRTYIENKMTEALVRTCYKCGKKFVKEDGCNKMTCTCGAKMCYVCRKPVSGYSHFNGQGGTEYHKCPLYSTNDELHVDLVQRVAEEAKAEVLQQNPQAKLVHDPTIIMPERSHDRPMPGMNNGVALNVGLRAIRGDQPDEAAAVEVQNDNQHHHHHHHHHHHQRRQRAAGEYNRMYNWRNNPYYNRYHRHRARQDEEDGVENDHHHHHHHQYHNHRHRHQEDIHEHRNNGHHRHNHP